MEKHYIIIRWDGDKPLPSTNPKCHATILEAQSEATRLALKHPGCQFLVYEARSVSVKQEVVTRYL